MKIKWRIKGLNENSQEVNSTRFNIEMASFFYVSWQDGYFAHHVSFATNIKLHSSKRFEIRASHMRVAFNSCKKRMVAIAK